MIIFDTMTDFLRDFTTRTFCMDGDCTVRYYGKDGGLALGIIRTNTTRKEGKVPQDIITVSSMDLNNIIGHIMATNNFPVNMGDVIVNTIRTHAISLVASHLHDNTAHIE
jgi:hypothetical protein